MVLFCVIWTDSDEEEEDLPLKGQDNGKFFFCMENMLFNCVY